MKKSLILLILMALPLLLSTTAVAWGPAVHSHITDELLDNPGNGEILLMCAATQDNRAAFLAGAMIPDITVVYYFEKGGETYRATHNWNFFQEVYGQAVTDNEKAFAYGIASHLIADSVAHQSVVPDTIKRTGVPNWLVHPLIEQKYDSYIMSKIPGLEEKSENMFAAVTTGPHKDRYIQMVQTALGRLNTDLNVPEHIAKLASAFGAFYEEGMAPRGTGIFVFYPSIRAICNAVQPLSNIIDVERLDAELDKTISLNYNTFNDNWGSIYSMVPHGFDEIAEADKEAVWFNISITIYILSIFITPILVYYFTKRILYVPIIILVLVLGLLFWIIWVYLTL